MAESLRFGKAYYSWKHPTNVLAGHHLPINSPPPKSANTIMFRVAYTALIASLCLASASAVASCEYEPSLTSGVDDKLAGAPVQIVKQDSETVTFKASQTFSDDLLCLMAVLYKPSANDEECPGHMNVGPGEVGEYTAFCEEGKATVKIFVSDGLFSGGDAVTPGICPTTKPENTIELEYELPCTPGEFCAPIEPVDCYDAAKSYDFEDGDAQGFMYGKVEGDSTNKYLALDADTIEISKAFELPSTATAVTIETTVLFPTAPADDQKLLYRLGEYYLNLKDALTMSPGDSEEMYFGQVSAAMTAAAGAVTLKLTLPDSLIESGSLTVGVRSVGSPVGVDDFKLSMSFTETCVPPFTISKNGGGGGDPHFQRWDHSHESFHGECDLVMVHSEQFHAGTGLDLHVRTKIEDYFSYIETAALRVGDTVLQFHKDYFYLDGTKYTHADLPVTFGGAFKYTIEEAELAMNKNSKFHFNYKVDLHQESSIIFKFYKKYLTIGVSGADKDFMDSQGLLGEYSTGNMVSRDGQVMENFVEYGFEWQVNPEDPKLFLETRSPQLPFEQCRMPTASRPARRKLRGTDEALFAAARNACAHVSGSDFDLCTDDVLTTGDLGLASMW